MNFKAWLEGAFDELIDMQYFNNGWDDTVYGLKNWTNPKETPQEWAERVLKTLEELPEKEAYHKGAISAMKKFLADGNIEYRQTRGPFGRVPDPGEDVSDIFSAN